MHRLNRCSLLAALALVAVTAAGCGNSKPAESASSDSDGGSGGGSGGDTPSGDGTSAGGEKSEDGGAPGEKKNECVGFDIGNLEDVLLKVSCEEPNVKPDAVPLADLKGKLEVKVTASPMKPAPGGKVDLLVSFVNKSKDPLTLHFKIDPVARFELELYDTKKNKRADMPAGNPPPPPKGATQPPSSEAKTAHLTIAPNGSARVRMPWEAMKMKWAPEKYRGTPPERGYPRAPAGPLVKGKYLLKVITPLVGVSEGVDHEISAPRVELEIGG